jgi:hypothetical protein
MKKVFNNSSEVMHIFAQRSQIEGKTSSRNVFFYNDKIYSYGHHYLLGEFISNKAGNLAIMINDKGYSVSTSKHIGELKMASRQYKQFFTTETEIKTVLSKIESNVKKLVTARKKELYILPSQNLYNKLNEFLTWSGSLKDVKKLQDYKKIVRLMNVINGQNLTEYLTKENTRIKAAAKAAEKKAAKDLEAAKIKFYNHDIDFIRGDQDFVRLSLDLQNVETSQNVKVTVKEAKILYNMIQAGKDIKGFRISNYTVISINGTLKIGCHNINIESMHRTGKELIKLF